MLDKLIPHIKMSQQRRGIIRCLLGVTSALLVATINNILLPQIAAIFALMLLDKGKNALGIKKSIAAIFVLYLLGLFGLLIGSFVQDYAWETLLIIGLVIFWTFKLVQIPEPIRLLFLILTLLLPFLSLTAEPLGDFILLDMIINLAIALGVTEMAFLFFPEVVNKEKAPNEKATEEETYNLDKIALNGLFVLMPVVLYFFYFRPNALVLTFVFILVLGLDPKIYKSKKGLVLILANLFGGACGVLAYNLLTITPTFFFYIFITLAIGLFFTYQIFSGKKTVPIYAIAYRTFFLVMGVISSSSESAGDTIVERLFGIGMAVLYVVIAYKVVTYFNDPRIYENEMV
jgi:MFS family permease